MLKIITFFFSSLSFNNVSLSTNLTTVGSPKEAKRDGLISWLVKDKCIHPVIIVFFLHTECKYNSVATQKWLRLGVIQKVKNIAMYFFILYMYSNIQFYNIYSYIYIWYILCVIIYSTYEIHICARMTCYSSAILEFIELF